MVAKLNMLALAGAFALAAAVPRATSTTAICTSHTQTVNFGDLPTGTLSPTLNYRGLRYEGWEVVAAKDTVFTAQEGVTKFLRVTGHNATIRVADKALFYDDVGTASAPSFSFGCQNETAALDCYFSKRYNVIEETPEQNREYNTYLGLFNATAHPHDLEIAGNPQTISVPSIFWRVEEAIGYQDEGVPHLYISNYIYTIGNCTNYGETKPSGN